MYEKGLCVACSALVEYLDFFVLNIYTEKSDIREQRVLMPFNLFGNI